MCDCKTRIEKELIEHFRGLHPQAANARAELMGYGLLIEGAQLVRRGYMPVECAADFPLKKGGTKRRVIKQHMFFSYCPFCGEKQSSERAQ